MSDTIEPTVTVETTVEKKPSFWKSLKFSSVKEEMENLSFGSKAWINISIFAGVYSGYLIGKKFTNSKLPIEVYLQQASTTPTTENDNEDEDNSVD